MPTVEENRLRWSTYEWDERGDEWSVVWGGTPYLWHAALFPRLMNFLPASRILEIAPGHGRFTQYLKDLCDELVIVDLTAECIDVCRERFREASNISYHVNDGKSLDFVHDGSLDFVFSFDSLVHAEADVLEAYVHELGSKLAPNGLGFLHHSNVEAYRDPKTGELNCENPHWRGERMSARLFREYCEAASLECISQELVNWGGLHYLTDSFSVFTPKGSRYARPTEVVENSGFMAEAITIQAVSKLYKR